MLAVTFSPAASIDHSCCSIAMRNRSHAAIRLPDPGDRRLQDRREDFSIEFRLLAINAAAERQLRRLGWQLLRILNGGSMRAIGAAAP